MVTWHDSLLDTFCSNTKYFASYLKAEQLLVEMPKFLFSFVKENNFYKAYHLKISDLVRVTLKKILSYLSKCLKFFEISFICILCV